MGEASGYQDLEVMGFASTKEGGCYANVTIMEEENISATIKVLRRVLRLLDPIFVHPS
jgi:hypothetical protein